MYANAVALEDKPTKLSQIKKSEKKRKNTYMLLYHQTDQKDVP